MATTTSSTKQEISRRKRSKERRRVESKRLSPSDCLRIIKHNGEISQRPIPSQEKGTTWAAFATAFSLCIFGRNGKARKKSGVAASMHWPPRRAATPRLFDPRKSVWSMRPTLRAWNRRARLLSNTLATLMRLWICSKEGSRWLLAWNSPSSSASWRLSSFSQLYRSPLNRWERKRWN